jgi:hypothetical protein
MTNKIEQYIEHSPKNCPVALKIWVYSPRADVASHSICAAINSSTRLREVKTVPNEPADYVESFQLWTSPVLYCFKLRKDCKTVEITQTVIISSLPDYESVAHFSANRFNMGVNKFQALYNLAVQATSEAKH